ncbi:MAG: universal stress protein [Bacteroidales bacterium]|jgi:nucleotide-binding universal stress UspA family protein|nr:universal stress protein [Bacteroidales bacterium]
MKNIVVGIDFSPSSENALRHAIAVAIKAKATIHLVYVKLQKASSAVEKAAQEDLLKKAVKRLAELTEDAKREAPMCNVQSIILEGKPALEICKYAHNLEQAMIAVGTHGTSGFDEKNVGSNTIKIVSETKIPVLSVREHINIGRDLTQILVPIDESFETLQKMKHAVTFAKLFTAKILLLGTNTSTHPESKHVINVQLGHAKAMCEKANVRYDVLSISIKDNICQSLVEYAKNADVNLMIIMREEEEEFFDFWLGTSTRRLISIAPMPLLIVPNINHFSVNK